MSRVSSVWQLHGNWVCIQLLVFNHMPRFNMRSDGMQYSTMLLFLVMVPCVRRLTTAFNSVGPGTPPPTPAPLTAFTSAPSPAPTSGKRLTICLTELLPPTLSVLVVSVYLPQFLPTERRKPCTNLDNTIFQEPTRAPASGTSRKPSRVCNIDQVWKTSPSPSDL